jgi:alanine racemase
MFLHVFIRLERVIQVIEYDRKSQTPENRGKEHHGQIAFLVRPAGTRRLRRRIDDADVTGLPAIQLAAFERVVAEVGGEGLLLHAANSAALLDLPQTHLDMVRPGITIYGYQPSDEMSNRPPLRPAMRLRAKLAQVKQVPAGGFTGYGRTYRFDRDSRIGLVPVGYADGFWRSWSNQGVMKVAGGFAPVRGLVSMDQAVIDLTDLPAARLGDEVEIISPEPADPHSAENLARRTGTIPYEIICRIGHRARRAAVE